MPRKPSARPCPRSRRSKTTGKPSNDIRSFLGDGSTEESHSDGESFRSADLNDQTDYDLEYTTSIVENPGKARRSTQHEAPTVSSTYRKSATQNLTSRAKPQRKQRTPQQLQKRFWTNVGNLQKRTDNLIPKAPFARVIREILSQESTSADRLTITALVALQEAAEMYLTSLLQDAYCCTLHRGRVTLNVKDIELTRFLRGVSDPGNR